MFSRKKLVILSFYMKEKERGKSPNYFVICCARQGMAVIESRPWFKAICPSLIISSNCIIKQSFAFAVTRWIPNTLDALETASSMVKVNRKYSG